MGHEFFTNEELKSWQSWMDSPASPPLSPSGVKKFTPDYENLDRDKAIEDFRERIKHYEDSYEPLSIEKEGLVGFTVIWPSNHFATKKSPRHQRIVCLHSISYLTLGTRGFSRVRREFSVLAEGRSRERRSGEAGHHKDLTETGNCARKVSGTQGILMWDFYFFAYANLRSSQIQICRSFIDDPCVELYSKC